MTEVYQSLASSIYLNLLITGKKPVINSIALLERVNTFIVANFAFISTR